MPMYLTIKVESLPMILRTENIKNIRIMEIKESVVDEVVFHKDSVEYDKEYVIVINMNYGVEYLSGIYTDENRAREEFKNLADIIAEPGPNSDYRTTDKTKPEWTKIKKLIASDELSDVINLPHTSPGQG